MRLLLDTNAIIWWDSKSSKLSKKAQAALRDTSNEVFISVVSALEMQIKAQIGKLKQHKPWQEIVREQIQVNGFPLLRPELSHIEVLDSFGTCWPDDSECFHQLCTHRHTRRHTNTDTEVRN